jgi:hypothetical protein
MMVALIHRCAVSLLCAGLVGCAVEHHEPDGAGASHVPSEPVATQIEILEGAIWPDGLWTGETQVEFACQATSRRLSVRFNPGSSHVLPSAFVVFGEQEKLPAELDPEQGYPEKHVRQSDRRCDRDEVYDGYPYRVRAATAWPTGRMTLWLSADELYDDWCALQTSYPGKPSNDAWAPEHEQWDHTCVDLPLDELWKCHGDPAYCPLNYDKVKMCEGRYCRCTAAGCRAPGFKTVRLDVLVADDRMEGVVDPGTTTPSIALKLRRVE